MISPCADTMKGMIKIRMLIELKAASVPATGGSPTGVSGIIWPVLYEGNFDLDLNQPVQSVLIYY